MAEKFTRRRLLIYPEFQTKLILTTVLTMLLPFSIFGSILVRSYFALENIGINANLPRSHAFFREIGYWTANVGWYFLLGFVLSAVAAGGVCLVLSHRIAGPMVRLRKELAQTIESGEFRRFEFRAGDYLS